VAFSRLDEAQKPIESNQSCFLQEFWWRRSEGLSENQNVVCFRATNRV